jgi:hypothetical protein
MHDHYRGVFRGVSLGLTASTIDIHLVSLTKGLSLFINT